MKKFYLSTLFILSLALSFSFTSCSNDDDGITTGYKEVISYENLPSVSKQFISDYFRGYTPAWTAKDIEGYEVSLQEGTRAQIQRNGYEIKFDRNGIWKEIEAYNDNALPETVLALVPRSIASYVAMNYPQRGINEIKKEDYGFKVELTGKPDVDLKFDINGNFLTNTDKDQVVAYDKLPQIAKDFITKHFSNLTVKEIKTDGISYETEFTNNVEIEFNLNGEWIDIDVDKTTMPNSVIELLPLNISSYLANNYPSNPVEQIKRRANLFEIELKNDIKIVFDSEGNLWSIENDNKEPQNNDRVNYVSLPASIKTILTIHFNGEANFLYAEKDKDEYDIKLRDGSEIDFDLQGNIKTIEVIPGKSVPSAIIPTKILSYVNANHSGKHIEEYEVKLFGYKIELSGYPSLELVFNKEGEFIGIDR